MESFFNYFKNLFTKKMGNYSNSVLYYLKYISSLFISFFVSLFYLLSVSKVLNFLAYMFLALFFLAFISFSFNEDFSSLLYNLIYELIFDLFLILTGLLLSLVFMLALLALSACFQFISEMVVFSNMSILFKILLVTYFLVILGIFSLEDMSKLITSVATYFFAITFASMVFFLSFTNFLIESMIEFVINSFIFFILHIFNHLCFFLMIAIFLGFYNLEGMKKLMFKVSSVYFFSFEFKFSFFMVMKKILWLVCLMFYFLLEIYLGKEEYPFSPFSLIMVYLIFIKFLCNSILFLLYMISKNILLKILFIFFLWVFYISSFYIFYLSECEKDSYLKMFKIYSVMKNMVLFVLFVYFFYTY